MGVYKCSLGGEVSSKIYELTIVYTFVSLILYSFFLTMCVTNLTMKYNYVCFINKLKKEKNVNACISNFNKYKILKLFDNCLTKHSPTHFIYHKLPLHKIIASYSV